MFKVFEMTDFCIRSRTLRVLLLLLSPLSQSLLVFFLCISRAQIMRLKHQSLKSIILFIIIIIIIANEATELRSEVDSAAEL